MKKLTKLFAALLTVYLFVGCGGDSSNDENTNSTTSTVNGQCMSFIIELLESKEGINKYSVVTNFNDHDEPITIDLRANDAVWTGPVLSGTDQLKWQVSALEKDATLYFTRSDSGCTEIVTLKGFGPYARNYDGTYRGNVTSNCESTVTAVLDVNDNIITGSTSDGYNIIGYRIEGSKVTGISGDGITWSGSMSQNGQVMSGTWTDGGACRGEFNLNKS